MALRRGAARRPLLAEVDAEGVATFRFPADRARHGAYVPEFMCAFAPGPRYTARYISHTRIRESIAFSGQSLPNLELGTFHDGQPRILLLWPVPNLREESSAFGARTSFVLYRRGPAGEVAMERLDFAHGMPGGRILGPMDQSLDPPTNDETIVISAADQERFSWCEMTGAEFRKCLEDQVPVRLDRHTTNRTLKVLPRANGEFELTASVVPYRIRMEVVEGSGFEIRIPDMEGAWHVRFGERTSRFDPAERPELLLE
jgi:hypothetical protein